MLFTFFFVLKIPPHEQQQTLAEQAFLPTWRCYDLEVDHGLAKVLFCVYSMISTYSFRGNLVIHSDSYWEK